MELLLLNARRPGTDRRGPLGRRHGAPLLTGHIVPDLFPGPRDRQKFDDAYNDPSSGILAHRKAVTQPKVAGPLTYTGQELVASDVANLKTGLAAAGLTEGFIASLSPGSCARVANDYYGSDEELLYACADAMREEYKASSTPA
ncbi:hypothetical protein NicSoilC12_15750 [Arthrobacter sp. NicSoilC12]|nr:hypothetical protein NicSoilC12_15750 [Arthrobacter sp. NicSoilC12]